MKRIIGALVAGFLPLLASAQMPRPSSSDFMCGGGATGTSVAQCVEIFAHAYLTNTNPLNHGCNTPTVIQALHWTDYNNSTSAYWYLAGKMNEASYDVNHNFLGCLQFDVQVGSVLKTAAMNCPGDSLPVTGDVPPQCYCPDKVILGVTLYGAWSETWWTCYPSGASFNSNTVQPYSN